MLDHLSSGDANVSAKSQFLSNDSFQNSNIGSSLDLLIDGRNLDTSPAQNTADKYLSPLLIDAQAEGSQSGSHGSTYEGTDLITANELAEVTESIFDDIDNDKNGRLSREELAASVQDNSFKGQEAQALTALYLDHDIFEGLKYDEPLSVHGITRSDLSRFDLRVTTYEDGADLLSDALSFARNEMHRPAFDLDRNDRLALWEIATVLGSDQLSEDDRRVLTYFGNNFEEVRDAHDDHEWFLQNKDITEDDIVERFDEIVRRNSIVGLIADLRELTFRTYEMQQPQISRALFADAEHPERSITPDAIDQGNTGDCYFLASVAALALSDPQSIVQMIKDNQDGTFTVTFPGDTKHPVTVNEPTDTELGLFNGGSPSGIWATVLEKAYGKYSKEYLGTQGLTDIEGAGNGGYTSDALGTLTGRTFTDLPLRYTSETGIIKMLSENFNEGHRVPTTVVTGSASGSESLAFTADGFPRYHAYTIVGAELDHNGEYTITIRNPWGDGTNTTSGTIDITIDQFMKNFSYISRTVSGFEDFFKSQIVDCKCKHQDIC